jgi:hypothetical protein
MSLSDLKEEARRTVRWHLANQHVSKTPTLGYGTALWLQAIFVTNDDAASVRLINEELLKDTQRDGEDSYKFRPSEVALMIEHL